MPPLEPQVKRGSAASTAIFHGAFGMVPTAALVSPVGALLAEVRGALRGALRGACVVHYDAIHCAVQAWITRPVVACMTAVLHRSGPLLPTVTASTPYGCRPG